MPIRNPIFVDRASRVTLINEDGSPYVGAQDPTTIGGASAAVSRVNSAQYEASHVLKNGAGSLVSLIGYNSGAGGWIQLFDAASLPTNGAAPVATFAVPGTGNFSLDVSVLGMPFGTGIVAALSTTGPTLTIGSASVYFTAVVK